MIKLSGAPRWAVALGVALMIGALGASPTGAAIPGTNGKIAFTSSRDGNQEIYVMNANGTSPTNITKSAVADIDPAWSADGTKIAFVRKASSGGEFPVESLEIHVMNADGTAVKRLTFNAANDSDPAWSPDGKRIAFQRPTGNGATDVYVMNADGSGQKALTSGAVGDGHPSWSSDGKKIVFLSQRDGNGEIYVMNSDGSGQKRLTNTGLDEHQPVWSPDGKKIAFTRGVNENAEIYVMNADGSDKKRLTNNAKLDQSGDWSPDGKQVIFHSNRDDPDFDVYAVNVGDLATTRLTTSAGADYDPSSQSVPAPELPKAEGTTKKSVEPPKPDTPAQDADDSPPAAVQGVAQTSAPSVAPSPSSVAGASPGGLSDPDVAFPPTTSETSSGFPMWALGLGLGGAAVIGSGTYIAWRRYR